METNAKLYTLNYDEAKTYLWAMLFVACNLVLPQLFHVIPQGGVIFAPLSLVILVGSYKFGWKTGLLAALASPLVNHAITGMPSWSVMPVMTFKLVTLAMVAGLVAQHYKSSSILHLVGVVIASMVIGALGEVAITGGIAATSADVTIGWPGLLLQVFGSWLILRYAK